MKGHFYLSLVFFVALGTLLKWTAVDETAIEAPKGDYYYYYACEVYVPNVFSPNGDGVNDLFMPATDCSFAEYRMRIFSRWGTLLYETTDPSAGWNGTYKGQELGQTSYVYSIEYQEMPLDSGAVEVFPEILNGTVALIK